jgi:hypothetical protein
MSSVGGIAVDYVSAFFLIDSTLAISKCVGQLALLGKYRMPDLSKGPYFARVRQIVENHETVLNVDHELRLLWGARECHAMLRCHSVDANRWEIEFILPEEIARREAHMFGDGKDRFFCAFKPPGFYD